MCIRDSNMLYSDAYGELTTMLLKAANELCADRLLMTHEGATAQ